LGGLADFAAKAGGALGWRGLERELDLWARAGRRPIFWWRDDDARTATPALSRLAALAERFAAPLLLAVVPTDDAPALKPFLQDGLIRAAQHGVDHEDRSEGEGARAQFHPRSPVEAVRLAVAEAGGRLAPLEPDPIYVPPWNTVTPNLAPALTAAGFRGVSGFGGDLRQDDGLLRLDAHIDVMRWSPRPRFRGEAALLGGLVGRLSALRRAGLWGEPTGLLTHHLDHDESAWAFLDRLFSRTPGRARVDWRSARELLPLGGV